MGWEAQGMEPCSSVPPASGLDVVQRAAPPAREPCPVAVDVVARAVMPACVEQPMSVTTAGFSAFGFVFFYAGATFFVRFLTCFLVSHNCRPFFCRLFPASPPHHSLWQRTLHLCQVMATK